jgi:predicted nucleotidyltransferase
MIQPVKLQSGHSGRRLGIRRRDSLHPIITGHREEIITLCRDFGVARLEVFGSIMTDRFDPDRSDVDFLVTHPPGYDFGPWLGRLQDFEAALSDVLGRPANVVMISALRNEGFAREANKTRTVIFDARNLSHAA